MRVPAADGTGSASHETVETILRFEIREAMWLLVQQTFRFARRVLQLTVNQLPGTGPLPESCHRCMGNETFAIVLRVRRTSQKS
jgi:hypothetical protein